MAFFLFILVNAALYLRPPELVESWKEVKVYEPLIVACLCAALLELMTYLVGGKLRQQPLTVLVIALLPVIFLSGLANTDMGTAAESSVDYFKVLVYYLLLVALVNTPGRLRQFLLWTTVFAGLVALLAVLRYHGVIELNTLEAMQDKRGDGDLNVQVFQRLRATGIFADPNDFASLLVLIIPVCLYWVIDGSKNPLVRLPWVPLLLLFGYTLILTQSRGGFVAALIAILVLLCRRYGPRAALALVVVLLPLAMYVFAARQTSFETEDTTFNRFQQWQEGLALLKGHPLLGVGMNQFEKHSYLVAHNSYMHCYGELGLIGGTLFLGAFFVAMWALLRLGSRRVVILDPVVRGLNPYLQAAVVGYAAALMSLSRSYVVPTYMVLGLVTVQLRLAMTYPQLAPLRLNSRLTQRVALASVGFLALMYVTCWLLVRYS